MSGQPNFGVLLERYFTQRLMQQRRASAHTIASYRDTFKMLLQFVHKRLRKAPSALALDDIDAPLVMSFLDEMERVRNITARTRNLRLTAVHSDLASVSRTSEVGSVLMKERRHEQKGVGAEPAVHGRIQG